MNWKSQALVALPILIGVIVYLPVLSFDFAWLDQFEILDRGLIINSFDDFVSTFLVSDGNYSLYHRPLYNLAHTMDLMLWSENPMGFHGTNLFLHAANLVLLTFWLKRLGLDKMIIAIIVLSWAVLPINAAVVALIHAKGDLLTTMFFLIGLNALTRPNFRGANLVIGISLLLALLSKETAVGGLLMIGIWKWNDIKENRALAMALISPLLIFALLRLATSGVGYTSFDVVRIATFPSVYASYFFESMTGLRTTVADSVWAISTLSWNELLMTSTMFVSALVVQVVIWKKMPQARPFILLFNCMLIPVSQVIPTLHFRADRFLYLASFGWIATFWITVSTLLDRKIVTALLALMLIGIQLINLTDYLPVFKNDRTLFTYTLDKEPHCREALSFLGLEAMNNKDYAQSKTLFLQALNGNPRLYSFVDRSTTKANLATISMRQGEFHEALNMFQGVEGGSEKYPQLNLNLGICYKMIGKPRKAFDYLTSYQNSFPDELQGMEKMAEVLIDLGKKQEAVNEFNRILRLYPDHPNKNGIIDAMYMLGG